MNRSKLVSAGTAALLLAVAAPVRAQTCGGIPLQVRDVALIGKVVTADELSGYGLAAHWDPPGGFALRGEFDVSDYSRQEDRGRRYILDVRYQLVSFGFSVCPFAEVELLDWTTEANDGFDRDARRLSFPVGISIGRAFSIGEETSLVPWVAPFGVYYSDSGDVLIEGDPFPPFLDDSGFEAGVEVGATFASSRFLINVSVTPTSVPETEPLWRFGAGMIFR